MTPRLVNVPDLAAYLGTTEHHIRGLVFRREIPFVKVGRSLRFDLREIDRWIADNTTEVAS